MRLHFYIVYKRFYIFVILLYFFVSETCAETCFLVIYFRNFCRYVVFYGHLTLPQDPRSFE